MSEKLVYQGKTKDVYQVEDGNYLLKFKDDVTGVDGVFDPGANTVGLSIEGMGNAGLKLTKYFFEILAKEGIATHYIDADLEKTEMKVLPAKIFGKGLEVICRFKAVGSFIRRYGDYIESGSNLDAYVEITLKDDKREDPLITKDALVALNILSENEYELIVNQTKQIATIIKNTLATKDLELFDIKLEFGRCNDKITLIDEIAGGNMRVFKNGEAVDPLDIGKIMLEE